jgi:hypothetical protein
MREAELIKIDSNSTLNCGAGTEQETIKGRPLLVRRNSNADGGQAIASENFNGVLCEVPAGWEWPPERWLRDFGGRTSPVGCGPPLRGFLEARNSTL